MQGILITPVGDVTDRARRSSRDRGTPVVLVDRDAGADGRSARSPSTTCSAAGSRSSTSSTAATAGSRSSAARAESRQVQDRLAAAPRGRSTPAPGDDLVLRRDRGARRRRRAARPASGSPACPADAAPDAAFCANDLLALGLLQAAAIGAGVRVPDDLAIVGYDDIEFAAAAAVPLSSVRQPAQQLGPPRRLCCST